MRVLCATVLTIVRYAFHHQDMYFMNTIIMGEMLFHFSSIQISFNLGKFLVCSAVAMRIYCASDSQSSIINHVHCIMSQCYSLELIYSTYVACGSKKKSKRELFNAYKMIELTNLPCTMRRLYQDDP